MDPSCDGRVGLDRGVARSQCGWKSVMQPSTALSHSETIAVSSNSLRSCPKERRTW